ncbi:MAG: hypothetical protein HQK91_09125 [Nitrospirae bacterium]|nr:hypothetical protein [Nitrospirota bacterium]
MKTEPTKLISGIKIDQTDPNGYKIIDVLARGNEYAIYEIDIKDINNSLRVLIDGHDDSSEEKYTNRFSKVKQKYIEAKGLLYRSINHGTMKNRVAHALASALNSDDFESSIKVFDELIETIKAEYKDLIYKRICYVLPSLFITIAVSISFIVAYSYNLKTTHYSYWQILCVILGSLIGGSFSIFTGLSKRKFEEFLKKRYYLWFGFERLFLALLAGTITFIILKSGLIFPHIDITNYWELLLFIVSSGFSEKFVPSVLEKFVNNKNE